MIREAAMNSVQRQPISAKMESDYKLAEGDALVAALEDIKMIELYYAEDDAGIAGIVKEYLEQKNFKVTVYGTLAQIRQGIFYCRWDTGHPISQF